MEIRRTNYLNLHALIEAQRQGKFKEQFELQQDNQSSEFSTESYCKELLEMEKNAKSRGLSAKDVIRKEFHTNY